MPRVVTSVRVSWPCASSVGDDAGLAGAADVGLGARVRVDQMHLTGVTGLRGEQQGIPTDRRTKVHGERIGIDPAVGFVTVWQLALPLPLSLYLDQLRNPLRRRKPWAVL